MREERGQRRKGTEKRGEERVGWDRKEKGTCKSKNSEITNSTNLLVLLDDNNNRDKERIKLLMLLLLLVHSLLDTMASTPFHPENELNSCSAGLLCTCTAAATRTYMYIYK